MAISSGAADFNTANVLFANNTQQLQITGLTITSATTNCTSSFAVNASLAVYQYVTWTGATSTDWNVASNWCGGIPTSTIDAIIPSGPTNQPVIGSAGGSCRALTINTGASVTLGGAYTLNVYGNWANSGTFNAATGTVAFSGTTTVSGSSTNSFYNATIAGSSSLTAPAANMNVAGNWANSGTFTHNSGTVTFNGSGAQAINSGGSSFNNFTITNTGGTCTAGNTITSAGTFTTNVGTTLNMVTYALAVNTVSHSGTLNTQNTSLTPITTGKTWGGTVNYNAAAGQTVMAGTYTNLTISGEGTNSKIVSGDITVNGILDLNSANASTTQGALGMNNYNLNMGATANTTGPGDVTGIVTRTSFVLNTPYSFGNQFTTMTFTVNPLPTSISFKIVLTSSEPTWMTTTVGMNRYYDITRLGGSSATRLTLNLHYLDTELNSAPEGTLDFFDNLVSGSIITDRGQNTRNSTDNWVSLTGLGLPYVANTAYDFRYWTLGTNNTGNTSTWISGGANLTDWNLPGNWNGGVPTSTSNVVIPAITVSGNADNPTLPATSPTINTINIQSGGVLNGGSGTSLTINGSAGAWQNNGTFNPGTSTVTFIGAAATMTGSTNFNNVTVSGGGALTLGANNYMGISGALTLTGTMDAATNLNIVDYKGTGAQTVLNPSGGTTGYQNLILSNSGSLTMPNSALSILGNFSMTGTANATALAAITTAGNFTIGSGTSFTTGAFSHSIGGNFSNSGTFTAASGSTIILIGSSAQLIGGTVTSTFNNLTISNAAGVTINTVNPTVNEVLAFTSGKITTGNNTLIMGNSATVTGAGSSSYVFGNLQKGIALNTTSKTFEIGNATNYLPTVIAFNGTGATNATGNITCNTTNGQQPNYVTSGLSQTQYLNRYWTVTNSGVTLGTYNATFTYITPSDEVGVPSIPALSIKNYNGIWNSTTAGTTTTPTVKTTGNTLFGDFVAGDVPSTAGNYFRSRVTAGNWNTLATWQSSSDSTNWVDATLIPSNSSHSIVISTGNTITIDATETASNLYIIGTLTSGSGIGLSVNGIWKNTGTFNAGTGTVTFNGTTTINGSSPHSFNNVVISGTLIGPASGTINVTGNWSNSGTFTHNNGTVTFNGSSAQIIGGTNSNTFYNLTVNNTEGVSVTTADQTVNHILTLSGANASATQGALGMLNNHILFMGASATTAGTGDVSGYINRSSFVLNTDYTFGNPYTLMNFTTGPLPTSVTLKVYLANAEPSWMGANVGIWRYYDVIHSGGTAATRLRFNAHYLDTELQGATEANLDLFDYHVSGPYAGISHDHGRTDNNTTNNWVGFSNVGLVFLGVSSPDDHLWTLGTSVTGSTCTWIGGSPSGTTDWNLPGNWEGGVPLATSNVIIPTATYNPVLPDGITINSLKIQVGGVLNATTGTPTLTIAGVSGWSCNGTFNAGASTVVFTHSAATMNGETNFNNVTVADGATLTPGTNNIMVIGNALALSGTGVINAATNYNTIEYGKSGDQTVIDPGGLPSGYSNLILSGSGNKAMPALILLGDLTVNGTAKAIAGGILTLNGNITLSTGTTFTAGTYTHIVKGNWVDNGATFINTGSTINFNGTSSQTIGGTSSTIFNNLTINNASGVVLGFGETVDGILNLTDGLITTGSYALTADCNSSITNAGATSYINGKLSQIYCGIGSKIYPIGKGGNYRPLTVDYTALSGKSTVTAEQFEATIAGSIPANTTYQSSRYWTVTQSGGSAFSYSLTLNGDPFNPGDGDPVILQGDGSTNTARQPLTAVPILPQQD